MTDPQGGRKGLYFSKGLGRSTERGNLNSQCHPLIQRHRLPKIPPLALLLLAIGLVGVCTALSASSVSSNETSAYLRTPFQPNPDSAALPADFRGHDLDSVIEAFRAFNTKQDEFENTSSYQLRLEQLRDRSLGGELRTGGTSLPLSGSAC
jgi:hypothetical protein